MAFNTGNPIGSTDARDLYDNATNLDTAANSMAARWTDRLGVSRPSWAGMISYVDRGAYGVMTITGYNEIFLFEGEYYRAAAATVLPYTTTGSWSEDGVDFVAIGDAALRQDLSLTADTTIGYYRNAVNCNQYGGLEAALADSDTLGKIIVVTDGQAISDNAAVTDRSLLIEYGGLVTVASTKTLTINGPFSAGDYQVFPGAGAVTGLTEARPEWWGAVGNDTGNDAPAINKALLAGGTCLLSANSTYKVTETVLIPATSVSNTVCSIRGEGETSVIKGYGAINVINISAGVVGTGLDYAGTYRGMLGNFKIMGADTSVLRGIYGRGAREMTFRDLIVEGTGIGLVEPASVASAVSTLGRSFTIAAIDIEEGWGNNFTNCRVRYGLAAGFWLHPSVIGPLYDGTNATNLTDCHALHVNGTGFILGSGGGFNVKGPWCEFNRGGGIQFEAMQSGIIVGGYFERNEIFDITTTGASTGISLLGGYHLNNNFDPNIKSIWLQDGGRMKIDNHTFNFGSSAGAYGVYIENTTAEVVLLTNVGIQGTNYGLYGGPGYVAGSIMESNASNVVFPKGVSGGNHSGPVGGYVPGPLNINNSALIDGAVFIKGYKSIVIPKNNGTKTIDITLPVGSSSPVLVMLSVGYYGSTYESSSYKTWDIFYHQYLTADLVSPVVTVKNMAGTLAANIVATCAHFDATTERITLTNTSATDDILTFIKIEVLSDAPGI